MMQVLFLFSPLRSGSNMVRSMLRDDPLIHPTKSEHAPVAAEHFGNFVKRHGTTLRPVKFGNWPGGIDACLSSSKMPNSCALILYRKNWIEQAASYFVVRENRSWFGKTNDMNSVTIDWELARTIAARIEYQTNILKQELAIPFKVLEYEEISVASVQYVLGMLLNRHVIVSESLTRKINSTDYVTNLSEAPTDVA